MTTEQTTLFARLNAPFPIHSYQYDSFGQRCYVSGQSVIERLNEVFSVGFWKYRGLHETEKMIEDPSGKSPRVKIYVEFSFYNPDLKEWITFIDAGSEQVKPGMNEGDATKSAITDGMKKCASRLGVASDIYNGLITWDKQAQMIVLPESYQDYYEQKGWITPKKITPSSNLIPPSTNKEIKKNDLTQKLKGKNTATQKQLRAFWQDLAGSLDGFDEWYEKKQDEKVTDQQILNLLQKKLNEKESAVSA
ncbi:MAG: Rad52/Rad22 family DNA repair protein [Paenibacillaceae bacterium]